MVWQGGSAVARTHWFAQPDHRHVRATVSSGFGGRFESEAAWLDRWRVTVESVAGVEVCSGCWVEGLEAAKAKAVEMLLEMDALVGTVDTWDAPDG